MKKCLWAVLCMVWLTMPVLSTASEFQIQPRVMAGYMYYKYEDSGGEVKDFMPVMGVGVSASVYEKLVADVYLQGTVSDGSDSYNGTEYDFGRKDISLSLGYPASDKIMIFAGYRWGDASFECENKDPNYDLDYEVNGPFLGAVISIPLEKGALSFNIAGAYLTIDSDKFPDEDAPGISGGISWKAPLPALGENFFYSLGAGGAYYKFSDSDIEETTLSVNAALSYSF